MNGKAHAIQSLALLEMITPFLQLNVREDLVYEACWCITNMAAGRTEYTAPLVEAGCIELLAELLGSDNSDIRQQATWALGNISGDCQEYRDRIMKFPGIVRLIMRVSAGLFLSKSKERASKHISIWCIANLCRWPGESEQLELAYPMLENVITRSNDPELLSESACTLRIIDIRGSMQTFPHQKSRT